MAHVTGSIEVDGAVEAIREHWTRFEELSRCELPEVKAGVRWRAEVLTFEPRGGGTRITLRIDYDPTRGDAGLSHRVRATLERFKSFAEGRRGPRHPIALSKH